MTIGILDQSLVRIGGTAKDAIWETIDTAILAEKLNYSRFWVSEHHNSTLIAGSTPELLMVKLADVTRRIRIGSGGIMLPNHSAFKVAESFRLLETMFGGRIDLGMGRAPGGDRVSSMLLNPSNEFSEAEYIEQLDHLQRFFRDTAATTQGHLRAVPSVSTIPQQWILSSSGGSALPEPSQLADYRFSPSDLDGLNANSGRIISGTKDEVAKGLQDLLNEFDADELMISTMGTSRENRLRSFVLVAETMAEPQLPF